MMYLKKISQENLPPFCIGPATHVLQYSVTHGSKAKVLLLQLALWALLISVCVDSFIAAAQSIE